MGILAACLPCSPIIIFIMSNRHFAHRLSSSTHCTLIFFPSSLHYLILPPPIPCSTSSIPAVPSRAHTHTLTAAVCSLSSSSSLPPASNGTVLLPFHSHPDTTCCCHKKEMMTHLARKHFLCVSFSFPPSPRFSLL